MVKNADLAIHDSPYLSCPVANIRYPFRPVPIFLGLFQKDLEKISSQQLDLSDLFGAVLQLQDHRSDVSILQ